MSYVSVTIGVTVGVTVCVTVGVAENEKTYVRKLKDMTCFKRATSWFAHLEKTSLVFSSSSFAVLVNL